jgi:hypothetical protein
MPELATVGRHPAPWRGRKRRPLYQAFLALVLFWGALLTVILVAEARAPVLPGRVTGLHATTDRRGTTLQHVDYRYTDAAGTEHADERELAPSIAAAVAPSVGAPVRVKLVLGVLPMLVGAPDALPIVPVVGLALFALLGVVWFAKDRAEAARLALALHGTLVQGSLTRLRRSSLFGTDTLELSYVFSAGATVSTGRERVSARTGELPLALGLDRLPVVGDAVTLAYDPSAPARSTLVSFGALPAGSGS